MIVTSIGTLALLAAIQAYLVEQRVRGPGNPLHGKFGLIAAAFLAVAAYCFK